MTDDYAAAVETERLAWLKLRRASENALVASIRVIWHGDKDAVRFAQIAATREDIMRSRWTAASDRLSEANARFVAQGEPLRRTGEANRQGEPTPM